MSMVFDGTMDAPEEMEFVDSVERGQQKLRIYAITFVVSLE